MSGTSGGIAPPAAAGSITLRVQGGLRGNVQGGSTIQSSTVRRGGRLSFVKIRD